jgi:hypothetical protein
MIKNKISPFHRRVTVYYDMYKRYNNQITYDTIANALEYASLTCDISHQEDYTTEFEWTFHDSITDQIESPTLIDIDQEYLYDGSKLLLRNVNIGYGYNSTPTYIDIKDGMFYYCWIYIDSGGLEYRRYSLKQQYTQLNKYKTDIHNYIRSLISINKDFTKHYNKRMKLLYDRLYNLRYLNKMIESDDILSYIKQYIGPLRLS